MDRNRLRNQVDRLGRFLDHGVHDVALQSDARLIAVTAFGGPWRAAWAIARQSARHAFQWRLVGPLWRLAHRLGIHTDGLDSQCSACRAEEMFKEFDESVCDLTDSK